MATYATVKCRVCDYTWTADLDTHARVREIYRGDEDAGEKYRFKCKRCGETFMQSFIADDPPAGSS